MRDRFLDALRAGSLLVVVAWHWFGVTLNPETYATRPSVSAPGLWLASWLLQVMPVFFFVGGFANLASFTVTREAGPVKHGTTIIAFVEDPDGYKIELIQR